MALRTALAKAVTAGMALIVRPSRRALAKVTALVTAEAAASHSTVVRESHAMPQAVSTGVR